MRIFNRIIVTLLLAGLFVAGVYGVIYSFGIAGYSLSSLEQTLGITSIAGGVDSFLGGLGQSALPAAAVAILVALAVLGLILLILELKPRRPRTVRTGSKNVYMSRSAVGSAVQAAAESTPEVLSAKAKAKARRGPGAKVKLQASIRRGEEQGDIQSGLKEQVSGTLSERGLPIKKLKLKLDEVASQGTKARVR